MTEPAIQYITKPINLKTTKEINNLWFADLEVEMNDYVAPECYVELEEELYIAKNIGKIKDAGKVSFEIKLDHAMVELNDQTLAPFTYTSKTPTQMLTSILAGSGWSIGAVDILTTGTIESDKRITCMAALQLMVVEFSGELSFNCVKGVGGTWTRTVDFKSEIGNATNKFMIRYDKNSDYIERNENTEKLCTRLYCYGKDDITIASVNGGVTYLDSLLIANYKNVKETTIYTNIDDVSRLLTYAQIYLDTYEHPLYTYVLKIFDKSVFPLWGIEVFNLGDAIRIYDNDLKINVDVRVKRIVKDLTGEKIEIELPNAIDKITDLLSRLNISLHNNTYQNNPSEYIPSDIPGQDYDDPIPIQGIYTAAENVDSWVGALSDKCITRDSNGYFHIVWEGDNSQQVYYGKSVDEGRTWTSVKITTSDALFAQFNDPTIVVDSSNNLYIACHGFFGSRVDQILLYKSTDGGSTWGAQFEIPFSGFWNESPSLGIDNNDHVHVVITRYYGLGSVKHSESTDGGATWSTPVIILDDTIMPGIIMALEAIAFEVSHDANDTMHVGIVVNWVATDIRRIIYKNSIDSGAHWLNTKVLNHSTSNNAHDINFAVGNVNYSLYYTWRENVGGIEKIYFNKVTNNVWGTEEVISNPLYSSYSPTISLDTNDRIYVAWVSGDGAPGSILQLKIRTYTLNTVWGAEYTRTTSLISKNNPCLIHAQNPGVYGLRPCIMNDGFAMVYEEGDATFNYQTIKFWIDASAIF